MCISTSLYLVITPPVAVVFCLSLAYCDSFYVGFTPVVLACETCIKTISVCQTQTKNNCHKTSVGKRGSTASPDMASEANDC